MGQDEDTRTLLGMNSEFYFISRLRNETGLRIPELHEFGFEVKIHPHSVVMPGIR
jgi:hypothetical protein